ncbi:MAG: hypothetical protein VKJ46_15690 [Leptolyngbyaceae bacterium]|nr:hypothetical protein [Leptolyngbyaceae bacterium]
MGEESKALLNPGMNCWYLKTIEKGMAVPYPYRLHPTVQQRRI